MKYSVLCPAFFGLKVRSAVMPKRRGVMWRTLRLFGELVKFEHTVFALPFAYVGCLMGSQGHPTLQQMGWVTVAMVGARTAGMTLNRVVDRKIDARNPRTSARPIPSGRVGTKKAMVLVAMSLGLLLLAAARLNPLALTLSPIAVGLLVLYSYMKRFTSLSHFGLGMVLACAPAGGWIAVRGTLDLVPVLLAGAVLMWVAGFDVLYACLDIEFDRRENLHSIPARWGLAPALHMARVLHIGTIIFLIAAGLALHLGTIYYVGLGVVAALLTYEHTLVSPNDLSKMDQAFFAMNGWVSVTLLIFTWLSYRMVSLQEIAQWITTR